MEEQSLWQHRTASGSIPKTEPYTESSVRNSSTRIPSTPRSLQDDSDGLSDGACPREDGTAVSQPRARINTTELPSRPTSSIPSGANALDTLSSEVKMLMDTIQKLRVLGFETSVVSLPKIVVIGDQSTGKSSVIEGISGIKVPRSAGTCTRCPLEINLSHSNEPWSCKVFLSRRYTFTNNFEKVSNKRPFGPWEQLDAHEEYEFALLHDKDDFADTLGWAQLATLNPSVNYQSYRPGLNSNTHQSKEVEFSPNVVRLDMSGPDLTNLAFYDLPGLISHVQHPSDQYLVKMVDNLAKEYMRSEETLILLTLTMNHDVQNSKAAGLIQRAKADDRTVGVFTKPDLLSPDSETLFVDAFAGDTFKRQLGYYTVKNNPDPTVHHAAARLEEKRFFSNWAKTHPRLGKYKARFGTDALTQELAKLLADRIRSSLPKIRAIIDEKILKYTTQLERLPKPPAGNLTLDICNNISALQRELEHLFELGDTKYKFFESWQRYTREFRTMLVKSYPRLSLNSNTADSLAATSFSPGVLQSRGTAEPISISDDEEESATPAAQMPRTPAGSSRKRERDGAPTQTPTSKRHRLTADSKEAGDRAKIFTIDQIREMVQSRDDTGLRKTHDLVVTKAIHSMSVTHWKEVLQKYINQAAQLCGTYIMKCVNSAFIKQSHTPLMEVVRDATRDFVKAELNKHRVFAQRCESMGHLILTLDATAITRVESAALEEMKTTRNRERVAVMLQDDQSLTEAQKQRKLESAAKNKFADLGLDEYERELQQMAMVRGYYEYAANRLAECVALAFRSETFPFMQEKLRPHLEKELRLDEDDANIHIRKLLEIDPDIANQRARCEHELFRLQKGSEKIRELEESGSTTTWGTESTQSTVL